MAERKTAPTGLVQPERLVYRLRWAEIQQRNRTRQTLGSRWTGDARWQIYPLMLVLFGGYWWFSVGFGRGWIVGVLLAATATAALIAWPALFSGWARLPVLHWTIFDPLALARRNTANLDGEAATFYDRRGEEAIAWPEFEGCDASGAGLTLQKGLRTWYLPARAFSSRRSYELYAALAQDGVNAGAEANAG